MRKRRLAAAVALAVSAAGLLPAAAHAASGTTIYVDSSSTACTNSGTGTLAAPYCSLQVGINAAVAGDTVVITGGGEYPPVTISNSGTAAAPITIKPVVGAALIESPSSSTTPAFTIDGASYVTIEHFDIGASTARNAYIENSNHITIDSVTSTLMTSLIEPNNMALPGTEITATSSDITLSRNQFEDSDRGAPSIQVDPGSTSDVITTNGISGARPAILVNGAPGTEVTSNTVVFAGGYGCDTGISLTGASTGSYVENNILEAGTMCDTASSPSGLLSIASSATSGTTVDYNVLNPNPNLIDPSGPDEYTYSWAGKYYETVAAFAAASGQGSHDIVGGADVTGPWGFSVNASSTTSPVINSANSDAPGELATDVNGHSRINDPLVPDAGVGTYSYYDRGAAQIQPTSYLTATTATANGSLGVKATSQAWTTAGWTFDFGDGTPTVPGTYGVATHTYKEPGTYPITVTGTLAAGGAFTSTTSFTTTALTAGTMFHNIRNANGSWQSGGWGTPPGSSGIAQASVTGMPDGSSQFVGVTTSGTLEYNIRGASGWQGWRALSQPGVTVTNASIAGMPNGSSQVIEVTSTGKLLHNIRNANGSWQSTGWGSPSGSTGITQAAITAMPNGDSQLVAITTGGALEFNIRYANSWQGWRTLSQPGVTITNASIAGMPNGSSQIIEVTSAGTMFHNVRNASGSWQSGGWGSPAGSTGIAQAAITAMPDGSSQFVAVTTSGALEFNIRHATGWQGWQTLAQSNLVAAVGDAGIAGMSNGSSQLIELTAN